MKKNAVVFLLLSLMLTWLVGIAFAQAEDRIPQDIRESMDDYMQKQFPGCFWDFGSAIYFKHIGGWEKYSYGYFKHFVVPQPCSLWNPFGLSTSVYVYLLWDGTFRIRDGDKNYVDYWLKWKK